MTNSISSTSPLPKGVQYEVNNATNPFRVRIFISGKYMSLGSFPTLEEASQAYQDAAVLRQGVKDKMRKEKLLERLALIN